MAGMNDATTGPRLDTATAISNLGGDRALYAMVVQTFLDDLPNQFAVLEAGLAQGDYATARRGAHTIKGMAMSVGAERLRQAALALEQACHAAEPAAIALADPLLRAELAASATALREYLTANS